MNTIAKSVIRLIRWGNLAIMGITQAGIYCCFYVNWPEDFASNQQMVLMLLATMFTAAAGYIINDYHDVKTDLLNKPEKVIVGNSISRRQAIAGYVLVNSAGLFFSFFVSLHVALATFLCQLSLWIYSTRLKNLPLSGNVLVAFLSALVVCFPLVLPVNIPSVPVFIYAFFAFITSLIREIVKDCEDVEGDFQTNSRTLPVVIGLPQTKRLTQLLILILVILLTFFILRNKEVMPFIHHSFERYYQLHLLIMALIPAIWLLFALNSADKKMQFAKLSRICKLMMVGGLTSMIWML